ncbi:hypothetical protein QTP88_024787 [Uroleucon formosanum]
MLAEQLLRRLSVVFIQTSSQGVPLSGPIIQVKAMEFHKKLNGEHSFNASTRWHHRFRNHHGIRQLDISGEKLSSDSSNVIEYKKQFLNMIKARNLAREQVYNFEETGLNWKALSKKTLATMSEKTAPGFKVRAHLKEIGLPTVQCCLWTILPLILILKYKATMEKKVPLFISNHDSVDPVHGSDFWKHYTLKDTMFNITQAWDDLPHVTLNRAWNKLWPQENDEDNNDGENNNIDENIVQMCKALLTEEKIENNDAAKWMNIDKLDASFEFLSDD